MQGTSGKNLSRAISTYLNQTGPGDYNLPRLFGEPNVETQKRTNPAFTFRSRVRLPWSPEHKIDFVGNSSPAATKYSPYQDNKKFNNIHFSVGKTKKFLENSRAVALKATLPVSY